MFTSEGTFTVRIDEIMFAEAKFATGPSDFDICIRVTSLDDDQQSDWWRLEVSDNYGEGNFASDMQKDISMKRLRKLGFEGDDLTSIVEQLTGKETTATVKGRERDGNIFYNIKYLGGSGATPNALAPDAVKARIAAMFGGGDSGAAKKTSPAPTHVAKAAAPKNPFAK